MIQITSICRGYLTSADRKRAIRQLKRRGFDHFVEYQDTAARYALCYGKYLQHPATQAVANGFRRPEQLPLF
jgi:hypothetical protein